ncbi:MAG: hypothetical protein JWL85_355 [Candidatus Saccharibacteria bacterium]|nr:hypothetical protein [Candidatus Saccharibacteria bacterium]
MKKRYGVKKGPRPGLGFAGDPARFTGAQPPREQVVAPDSEIWEVLARDRDAKTTAFVERVIETDSLRPFLERCLELDPENVDAQMLYSTLVCIEDREQVA